MKLNSPVLHLQQVIPTSASLSSSSSRRKNAGYGRSIQRLFVNAMNSSSVVGSSVSPHAPAQSITVTIEVSRISRREFDNAFTHPTIPLDSVYACILLLRVRQASVNCRRRSRRREHAISRGNLASVAVWDKTRFVGRCLMHDITCRTCRRHCAPLRPFRSLTREARNHRSLVSAKQSHFVPIQP